MICFKYLCVWEGSLWPITITFFNLCLHFFLLYTIHFKKNNNNFHRSLP